MVTKNIKIRTMFNVISVIGFIVVVILCVCAWSAGLFRSVDALSVFVQGAGVWGPLVFILLQIIQVVIPIIPGGITCLAGVIIFGPLYGFIYNYAGISIGSIIAFFLSRIYGRPFIESISSKRLYDKYIGWLDKGKRFDVLFAVAIFLPVAPDDFLCMLAGLTKMKLLKFVIIILLCKPASIYAYSLGLSTITAWIISLL